MALPIWRIANGWREIFAKIFDDFETQFNVSPEWLVNPATNRRLKLDMLYPEVGIALRFEGMTGKKKRRLSLEEEELLRSRFDARIEVCWQHGIHLVVVDLVDGKAERVFQQIDTALSRAAEAADEALRAKIKATRRTASELTLKVRSEGDLALYADLWMDRQYQLAEPESSAQPAAETDFAPGMEVEHTHFGPGVVLATEPQNGDTLIIVDFVTAGQKTLAASLVGGKLLPRS